jgi:poly(hydroxyalkanoate) granule-associated protein
VDEPARRATVHARGERTMLKKAKAEQAAGEAGNEKAAAKEAGKGAGTTKDVAQGVLDSSHQIWLAGLGAFSQAKHEGTKLFETLVKQGEQLQVRTKRVATETAVAARGVATAKAKEMQQMAGGTWDKLEQVFEDRVAKALSKLGVYTQNDVQRLAARVDELAAAVNKLVQSGAGGSATAPTKSAAKRTRAPKKAAPPAATVKAKAGKRAPKRAPK